MAISALKTWIAGEVLTASDLNGMNTNILNNALSLISPLTGNLNFNNNQATNMRLEVQTATQAAAQSGRIYWQSTEGTIHLDTGSLIGRAPALTGIQQGRLVGITNPSGVSGATVYSQIELGANLTLTGTSLAAAAAVVNPLQSVIFN